MRDILPREAKMEGLFFGVYSAGVTLAAIVIPWRVSIARGLLGSAPPFVKVATVCLLSELPPLSLSFLLTFGRIAFLCCDYCPPNVPGSNQTIVLTNMSWSLLCLAG